jgi:hypothetical protein
MNMYLILVESLEDAGDEMRLNEFDWISCNAYPALYVLTDTVLEWWCAGLGKDRSSR